MASRAEADIATLKNGMQYEGVIGKIGSLGEDPLNPQSTAGQVKVRQIVFVDDELRRTFFSQIQVQAVVPSQLNLEKIRIEQRVAKGNRRIAAVGPIVRVTPFDEWGRRIFTMNTSGGPIDVIQGITEITPIYTKVEGLAARGDVRLGHADRDQFDSAGFAEQDLAQGNRSQRRRPAAAVGAAVHPGGTFFGCPRRIGWA